MTYRSIASRAALGICFWLLTAVATTAFAQGLMQSSEKVDVTAQVVEQAADGTNSQIQVRLDIDDGWHVNPHPASLDFLIATDIELKAGDETLAPAIDWPSGQASDIELDGTRIEVYNSDTVIPVTLGAAARQAARNGQLSLAVRVQSCSDDGLCLPPSTLNTAVTEP